MNIRVHTVLMNIQAYQNTSTLNMHVYVILIEFEPEFIRGKSLAAAGLCSWVINIMR